MTDQLQLGFQFGNVSEEVLGNIDQTYYNRCFFEGINAIGKLSGALVKRPAMRALFSEEQPGYLAYRIFQAYFENKSYLFRWILLPGDTANFRVFDANTGLPVTAEQPVPFFSDINKLSFAFKDNFGIFCHPEFHPLAYGDADNPAFAKLKTKNNFTLVRYPNFFGPLLDQNNDTTLTLQATSNPPVGGTTTLNASSSLFLPEHLLSVWAATEPIGSLGSYPAWTTGTSYAIGSFVRNDGKVYQATTAGTAGNISPTHDEDGDIQSDGGVSWLFCNDGIGYFQIQEIVSPTQATVLIQRKLPNTMVTTPTWRWNEAAWSGVRGYPSVTTLFEQRIVFASTRFSAQTLWATKVGSELSFLAGAGSTRQENDAVAYELYVGGKIEWVLGARQLLIGGKLKVQQFTSLSSSSLATQLSIGVEDASTGNQAFFLDNLVAYIGLNRNILRVLIYREDYQSFVAYNPEFLNPQALSNCVYLSLLTQPKTVLTLKNDGSLAAYQLDIQRTVDGIYDISNNNLEFLSLTSDRTKAFIAANNRKDDVIWVGTFNPDDQNSSYVDFDQFNYELSIKFPPPSSWTPPIYAGSLKRTYGVLMQIRYLKSGTFFLNGTQINAKRADDPLGELVLHTNTSSLTTSGPFPITLQSPTGMPLTVTGALFTFRTSDEERR